MKKQAVVVFKNSIDIQQKITSSVNERNSNGWELKQICSHGTDISYWTLLFEREEKDVK